MNQKPNTTLKKKHKTQPKKTQNPNITLTRLIYIMTQPPIFAFVFRFRLCLFQGVGLGFNNGDAFNGFQFLQEGTLAQLS